MAAGIKTPFSLVLVQKISTKNYFITVCRKREELSIALLLPLVKAIPIFLGSISGMGFEHPDKMALAAEGQVSGDFAVGKV
jgi:hypothetical protein